MTKRRMLSVVGLFLLASVLLGFSIKWSNNAKVSWPTIQILDGNTIDNLGFVSSSGYGDGVYCCWTAHNDEGKIVAIRVEYLTEVDEEDM